MADDDYSTTGLGGVPARALAYGPVAGDPPTKATTYGPLGNRLGPKDVALSPNLQKQFPLGSSVNAVDASGNVIGTYQVADSSWFGPGVKGPEAQPTTDTIEFRDKDRGGKQVYLQPADGSAPPPPPTTGLFGKTIDQAPEKQSTPDLVQGALKGIATISQHNAIADKIFQQAMKSATQDVAVQLGNYAQGNGLNTGNPRSALQEIARYMGSIG